MGAVDAFVFVVVMGAIVEPVVVGGVAHGLLAASAWVSELATGLQIATLRTR